MPIEYLSLSIDEEFEALCPPLSESEMEHLASSIEADGVRDAVVYWSNSPDGRRIVVDGHNRRYIAEQTGAPYPTLGMEFADRDAVVAWIVKNQLGRRNVTSAQRDMLLARLYRQRVQPVGNPALSNGITVIPLGNPAGNDESRRTREAVAEEAGVSPATVSRALKSELALKTLGCRAPGLRQAALAGVIGPKAVKELAKVAGRNPASARGVAGESTQDRH